MAKGRNHEANHNGGNPAARGRRRATSVPPTRNARLYVGNLSYEATEAELEDLFKGFGDVRSVEIIYNNRTYKSKGYAFVEMRKLEDARRAAEILHGQPFMGRELMVSAASEKSADNLKEEEASAPDSPEAKAE
ncbi:MAG: RNA-binding protein [Akkermansiaceae bacterium]|nr:RNA-binding protein [Akkermansiaceae bacterium]